MQGSICVYVKGGKLTSLHRLRTKETCDKNLEEAILDSLIQPQQKVCNTEKNKQTHCTQEIIKVYNLLLHLVSFVLFTFLLSALCGR